MMALIVALTGDNIHWMNRSIHAQPRKLCHLLQFLLLSRQILHHPGSIKTLHIQLRRHSYLHLHLLPSMSLELNRMS
uniref:Uncharacterized protein n=1 Tax=Cannabis sativa TaxID=3483 RepID=A0A803QT19_CANSA